MASHRLSFHDLSLAVRLLRETVAAFEQAQIAERDENERQLPDLPTLDQLLARHGVDIERLDPELAAMIKRAQMELGDIKPEEPE